MPRVGQLGGPIAELTRLGCVLISPGKELELRNLMVIKTSTDDYENLYRLDVLGVTDRVSDEGVVVPSRIQGAIKKRQKWLVQNWFNLER